MRLYFVIKLNTVQLPYSFWGWCFQIGVMVLSVMTQHNVRSPTMRCIATSLPPPADASYWHPSRAPPRLPLFSILSSSTPPHFELVVVSIIHWRQSEVINNDGNSLPHLITITPMCFSRHTTSPECHHPRRPAFMWLLCIFAMAAT